jgi:hypothetical protein
MKLNRRTAVSEPHLVNTNAIDSDTTYKYNFRLDSSKSSPIGLPIPPNLAASLERARCQSNGLNGMQHLRCWYLMLLPTEKCSMPSREHNADSSISLASGTSDAGVQCFSPLERLVCR